MAVLTASAADGVTSDPDASTALAGVDGGQLETPRRELRGRPLWLARVLAVALSMWALWWVIAIVEAHVYRTSFLLLVLVLTFLRFPARRRRAAMPRGVPDPQPTGRRGAVETSAAPTAMDWTLAVASLVALAWPLLDRAELPYRAATPTAVDLVLGVTTILLVLEATRRTAGWLLAGTIASFMVYAWIGPVLELVGLGAIAHRGYHAERLVGTLYMTLDGIFGVPLDVAATYIILFSIFGAVLQQSGAGRFFIDWSLAALGRSRSVAAPGRSVTLAGFLLGTVSGSGVATTVTLGSTAWPLLRGAGYSAETAGAVLSAAGIGALLSPPTMGAAAFLIAEFLEISYLQVLVMATIPMLLYYLSAFLMIETDIRRTRVAAVVLETPSLWALTRRGGYHFLSLIVVAALMVAGTSAFRAVFWATVLALVLSFLDRATALRPRRLLAALEAGAVGVLPVAATTAAAGIIVGVVGLTGLGLKLAGLIVGAAGGSVVLTVVLAAIAIWVLGLALPVTASYILGAVMIAPALVEVGIPAFAAHMFVFYYAVLSEVSPPTALSPFAAAAITGGDPLRTTMRTWRYTLPAFLVPLAFTLSADGAGLLLQASAMVIARTTVTAALGIVLLALGVGGGTSRFLAAGERVGAVVAGVLLVHAGTRSDVAGLILAAVLVAVHILRTRRGD